MPIKVAQLFTILIFTYCLPLCHQAVITNNSENNENVQNQQNQQSSPTQIKSTVQQNQIYGVRWSLGNQFSYTNLYKTHPSYVRPQDHPQNSNFYTLSFNSESFIKQEIFLEIGNTTHSCSHKFINVQNSDDRDLEQMKQNTTLNATSAHIYKCQVNIDLTKVSKLRYLQLNPQTQDQYFEEFPYSIYTQQLQYMHYKDDPSKQTRQTSRKIKMKRNFLFEGKFRSAVPILKKLLSADKPRTKQKNKYIRQNILVMGDWGEIPQKYIKSKGYIPILQQTIKKLQNDKNIVLAIFLGDLAYDLVGERYVDMLKYIEPITSRISFMPTPGNHDYFYHKDCFQIFTETFSSPEWQKYFNFYYTFILGDFMFINYVPENALAEKEEVDVKPIEYMLMNLYNNYPPRLSEDKTRDKKYIIDQISSKYHVIVFSHYPVVCSKTNDDFKSCQKNKYRLKEYIKIFNLLGADLFLSGHLHYYQRTHQVCLEYQNDKLVETYNKYNVTEDYKEGSVAIQNQIYDGKCPIYVVDGNAGNYYFQQEEGAIKPEQFSSKVSFNTGFGILSLKSQNTQNNITSRMVVQNSIQFSYYKMLEINRSKINDKFTKKLQILQQYRYDSSSKNNYLDSLGSRVFQLLVIFFLFLLGSIICFCFGRYYVQNIQKSRTKRNFQHEQMVQQNYGDNLKSSNSDEKKQKIEL